jgi:argininosuccinate lyase
VGIFLWLMETRWYHGTYPSLKTTRVVFMADFLLEKTMKLWQKNSQQLNSFIEAFETRDDLLCDQKLIPYDVYGSLAHAKMLYKIKIISKEELTQLEEGLKEILKLNGEGKFVLEAGDEDIHTKIENFLTEKYGEAGKKIHTARSRNDQILTAMRLFGKAEIETIQKEITNLLKTFKAFNKKYGTLPMPGYTHMQKAMPTSIGMWIGSFIASLQDDSKTLQAAYDLMDQSPLGSAAGYGVHIKLDKQYTADLLNFSRVQENPIYCQHTRGKFEAAVLAAFVQILMTINKFASDVLLFTTQEFNFFEASGSVTTGSSIMPQKKNLDLAELLRSKVHIVLGHYTQIISLNANLISGYNRDYQESKKPFMESLELTKQTLQATQILLQNLKPKKKQLTHAMTEDLFATEEALNLVLKGQSFRNAYQKIGQKYVVNGKKS